MPSSSTASTVGLKHGTKNPSGLLRDSILPSLRAFLFSTYHITLITVFIFLSNMVLPLNLQQLCSEHKASLMGLVMALSAVYSTVMSLLFGFIVDWWNGKRFRFFLIVVSTILFGANCFALSFFYENFMLHSGLFSSKPPPAGGSPPPIIPNSHCSLSNDVMLWIYFLLVINCKGLFSVAHAPYYSLIPQLFKDREYGRVSGFVGVGIMLGALFASGVIASVYQYASDSAWMIILNVFMMLSLVSLSVVIFADDATEIYRFLRKCLRLLMGVFASQDADPEFFPEVSVASINQDERTPLHLKEEYFTNDSEDEISAAEKVESSLHAKETASIMETGDNVPLLFARIRSLRSSFKKGLHFIARPFRNLNFILCFLNRFFFFAGLALCSNYQLFYLQDVLGPEYNLWIESMSGWIDSPARALSLTTFFSLFAAVTTSMISGWVSDKWPSSRLHLVFFGCLICGALQALIPVVPDYTYYLILIFGQGVTLGLFVSTNLALTNEIIEDKSKAGTEFSLLSMAQFVPQLAVSPLGGLLLEWGQKIGGQQFSSLGYWFLYFSSGILYIASAVVLIPFKRPKRRDEGEENSSKKKVPRRYSVEDLMDNSLSEGL